MADLEVIVKEVNALIEKIETYPDPRRASTEWKQAYNQLKKTDLPKNKVDNVVAMRGLVQLKELVAMLQGDGDEEPSGEVPSDDRLHQAMRAFRKKLRTTQLDQDSEFSSRDKLSAGGHGRIEAIEPPKEYEAACWRELVKRGQLRAAGAGMYEIVD